MSNNVFLDKGLLLGYCFTVDKHHEKCKAYLSSQDGEFYITEDIDGVFAAKRSKFVREHREAILDHVKELTKSNYSGRIGPMEIQEIQEQLISTQNEAWRYLRDYYDGLSVSSVYEVKEELRGLAREMETLVDERKNDFDEMVTLWTREDDYSRLHDDLSALKSEDNEDFWVCVDAHDLAHRTEETTVLATNNPSDFGPQSHGETILASTALDDIDIVAVTGQPRAS